MSTGLVMRSTGSRYIVRGEDGVLHTCIAKGKLRIKGYSTTNPLAVGDAVDFIPAAEVIGNEHVGAITKLHQRRNYLVRKSVNLSHHKHAIASNMDQCLILVTLARPRTSFGFIDRVLVTAEAYKIPPRSSSIRWMTTTMTSWACSRNTRTSTKQSATAHRSLPR